MTVSDTRSEREAVFAAVEGIEIEGCCITRQGLQVPEEITYDRWLRVGTRLREIERGIQWAIGDWWNFGEHHWSEEASQAVDGLDYDTVRRYGWVAARYEPPQRRSEVSFEHHATVANRERYTPEEAGELLDRADPERNETGLPMPLHGFRAMVRNHDNNRERQTVEPRPVSVCTDDAVALVTLIGLHAQPHPQILDVTHNYGTMWVGTAMAPHRMDINPMFRDMGLCDTIADCRDLPFGDRSFDVIVFDPPHITDAGDDSIMGQRYGSLEGADISGIFEPFLRSAQRVLQLDGIVVAKIIDVVHGGMHRWQHVDLIKAAQDVGFTACDLMVKATQTEPVEGSSWQTVRHVRNAHAYWIVLRKGADNCDRGGYAVAEPGQSAAVVW